MNSGKTGEWEGRDIPEIRKFIIEARQNEEEIYRPIEFFGKLYMPAEGWNTNDDGHKLIAEVLFKVLKEYYKMQQFLTTKTGL